MNRSGWLGSRLELRRGQTLFQHGIFWRGIAHAYGSDCLRNITAEFISNGSAKQLDTACITGLRPPAFVRELPAELK
jgi:hypothetical protein